MATVLYVGTNEGVVTLRSASGTSWHVESHGLKNWEVPAVAVDAAAPNRVLAATRGDGVWLSEDFGQTWKKPCYGKRGPGKLQCLTLDPRHPQRVYAGGEPIDLFVSDDLGKSWERLESVRALPFIDGIDYPVKTVEPHVRDIVVDPKDPNTVYAALQVGFMIKSTDGGKSWKRLDQGVDADIHTIVVDPTDTSKIVVATGGHDARLGLAKGRALYMSTDAGESWTPVATQFQEEYSVPLVMHPKNPAVLYAGLANGQPGQWRRPTGAESRIVRTKDGGRTWESLDGGLADLRRGFPEAIAFAMGNSDHLYAGFRSGEIICSDDDGDSWLRLDVAVPTISDLQCVHA